MMIWQRIVVLAAALAITLIAFEFWGELGSAIGKVLALPEPNSGVVSVQIIPTPKPSCTAAAPCPQPAKPK